MNMTDSRIFSQNKSQILIFFFYVCQTLVITCETIDICIQQNATDLNNTSRSKEEREAQRKCRKTEIAITKKNKAIDFSVNRRML